MWGRIAGFLATQTGGSYAKSLAFIVFVLPIIIGSIIKILGIAFIVYVGSDLVLDQIFLFISDRFNGLPAHVVQLLQLAGVDTAIKMVTACISACIAFKGLSSTRKFKFTT